MNNPASAEGFTVIFSKARDEKKSSNGTAGHNNMASSTTPQRNDNLAKPAENYEYPSMVLICNKSVDYIFNNIVICLMISCEFDYVLFYIWCRKNGFVVSEATSLWIGPVMEV